MKNITFALFFCLARFAMAAPIYGTSASTAGSTTLSGFGNWLNPVVSWQISDNGNGTWNYSYSFVHGGSDLSHLVLEFTQGCGQDPGCITNATNNPDGPKIWNASSPPNFELAAAIYGVKFDGFSSGSPNTWSFTSNRAPVWGDIYLRDGGNAYAENAGLTNHQSEFVADFVARPNGSTPNDNVPEPSSFALAGLGLGVLTWRRLRG